MTFVSVIISTRGRYAHLEACLDSFASYYKRDNFEILIVDNNNPRNKEITTLLSKYPVRVVHQPQQGISKSHNLGINLAKGDIIAFTDDDVIVNPDWLDTLLRNFQDAEVAYVSGQVLPLSVEKDAQRFFEDKGGLSKGKDRREFDYTYFKNVRWRGVPVYLIAMGANSAVRKNVLVEVGCFDERFGVGGFLGAGETGELCYRIMRAGYKVVYDPVAIVYHNHESDYNKLRFKLFRYGLSDTAQQMKFLITFGDCRGLIEIFCVRPYRQTKRILQTLFGSSQVPIDLILAELFGNFIGPLWYLISLIVVK